MSQPYSVAIIGCGPRGMFALDEMLLAADGLRLEIAVFEASGNFGTGNIYATEQPQFLRMNYASENIDVWSSRSRERFPDSRPSLLEWLETNDPSLSDRGCFIPRAKVGRYLSECFDEVLSKVPAGVKLTLRAEAISSVSRVGAKWIVRSTRGSSSFDEILLAVGHEGWRPPGSESEPCELKVIDRIFPVSIQLNNKRIAPGSPVAVKGFSLTWIDAALALTEGRGGTFATAVKDGGRRYTPSGSEPDFIAPFSRTGRPMLSKPIPDAMSLPNSLAEFWDEKLDSVRQFDGAEFDQKLIAFLFDTADEALSHCGNQPSVSSRDWFHAWCEKEGNASFAINEMRNSVETAYGRRTVGQGWALGETWRQLYPGLVRNWEHGKLPPTSWPAYSSFAGEMERIAFGPPACNLSRIVGLVEAGVVDLSYLRGPHPKATVMLDARIPGPVHFRRGSVLDSLEKDGFLRKLHGNYGIETDRNSHPLDKIGRPVPGLGVIGRATEGCVIGNDTLSRTLNPHPATWASSVIGAARKRESILRPQPSPAIAW